MSLLTALYRTYNSAIENDMVDRTEMLNHQTVLLPVYHSSKKSTGLNDIIEVTLSEEGKFIKAEWVNQDKIVIYPVTEDSIIRSSSKIAPHPLCDELSYLAVELNPEKHIEYERVRKDWVSYMEEKKPNQLLKIIDRYLSEGSILTDCISSLFSDVNYDITENYSIILKVGKKKEKVINLNKTFVTFRVEVDKSNEPDLTVSTDKGIHQNYISYVRSKNMKKSQERCDISGEITYCVSRHRGLIGNAKLISSNNKEAYYGRFDDGEEIIHIGYETSQKIHLMLKYLLENYQNNKKIGEDCYVINWFSNDIGNEEQINLIDGIYLHEAVLDETLDDEEEDEILKTLGGSISAAINDYITGKYKKIPEGKFYIMIIEKSSKGRIAVKYFKELQKSELMERVKLWYQNTSWSFYNNKTKAVIEATPSLYKFADSLLGKENDKGYLECKNSNLKTKTIERLLLCILENRRFPYDLKNRMLYNLYNRNSYEKTWNYVLSVGCSIFKKYQMDYYKSEVNFNMISSDRQTRSYLYGRLLAAYEKLEQDVLNSRVSDNKNRRPTNAERFWNAYNRMPAKTLMILENKIRPYKDILIKLNNKSFSNYDRIIQNIMCELRKLDNYESEKNRPLDEDFIFGYYAQKQEFYIKKEEKQSNVTQ